MPWLSPIFDSLPSSLFITDKLSSSKTEPSSSIPFHQPLLQSYIQYDVPSDWYVDTSIINLHHSITEPQVVFSNNRLNSWFGIIFQNKTHTNHIRVHQPSEILTLN